MTVAKIVHWLIRVIVSAGADGRDVVALLALSGLFGSLWSLWGVDWAGLVVSGLVLGFVVWRSLPERGEGGR